MVDELIFVTQHAVPVDHKYVSKLFGSVDFDLLIFALHFGKFLFYFNALLEKVVMYLFKPHCCSN